MSQSLAPAPYGGELVDLMAGREEALGLHERSRDWRSHDLTPRQLCDIELLLNGAFSPLRTFMGSADHDSVCRRMRLADDTLWPIPLTLDLPEALAHSLGMGECVALRDPEGVMLASLCVREVFRPDRELEAISVFGTTDVGHPGVRELTRAGTVCATGELTGVSAPRHYDFAALRRSPAEVRADIERRGWRRVVAFQTRNPMHRAHQELTLRAAAEHDAGILLHPVVGSGKPGDIDHYTRIRCYRALMDRYPDGAATLALLPLAMRMAGPREALWHAIVRRNHGASHLIVGRDHAGPGDDRDGTPYYDPYAAQELLRSHEEEVGVEMVPFRELTYVPARGEHVPVEDVEPGEETCSLSGTELRRRLEFDEELPEWFTYPEVARELQRSCAPRSRQGFTVFMTGFSGSGKSTVAGALLARILELGDRPATLLDGDVVRKHLSSELGFSREDRELNIHRIGYVASEITRNGGIAICAPIAPYRAMRDDVRAMIEPVGGFLLVHISTPLEVCEGRDRKGLYAKARAGMIDHFTGISDPYEPPEDADLRLDTSTVSPAEGAQAVLDLLSREGYLPR